MARHGGDKRNCEVFFNHWVPCEILHLNLAIFMIMNKDGDDDGKESEDDGKDGDDGGNDCDEDGKDGDDDSKVLNSKMLHYFLRARSQH